MSNILSKDKIAVEYKRVEDCGTVRGHIRIAVEVARRLGIDSRDVIAVMNELIVIEGA